MPSPSNIAREEEAPPTGGADSLAEVARKVLVGFNLQRRCEILESALKTYAPHVWNDVERVLQKENV